MNLELVGALNELERERGISKDILLDAIQAAIVSAYKRNDEAAQNIRVDVSDKSGQIQVFAQKEVVEEVLDGANEISLEAARATDPNYDLGDTVEVEVTPRDFGRIAAQTAKQVVIQRIREAERALVYEEYSNREGDVVTGIVQRSDYRNVLVDLGKVEAILPPSEQMPKENYSHGNRIKTYVSEVRQTTKGPQVIVSRTHPGLLKRLFELEVPEIHDGVVEIRAVAREAGNRSKIAVSSNDPNVDPVGACVGPRGMRVQTVVQELKGEKIDIVEHALEAERFVGNALSPARVVRVYTNEEEKTARAVVPDHQLSLAIGREGQNARLAARLSGWKIDIKSESQMAELALLEAQRAGEDQAEDDVTEVGDAPVGRGEAAAVAGQEVENGQAPAAAVDTHVEIDETPAEVVVGEESPAVTDEVQDEEFEGEDDGDSTEDGLEIPDEVFEELEEATTQVEESAQPKVKKSRAAKKAELKDMIEEDVFDEDEPLPSLFEGEEEESDGEALIVADEEPAEAEETDEERVQAETREAPISRPAPKESKGKDKLVLKDLSQLASLLDAQDNDKGKK